MACRRAARRPAAAVADGRALFCIAGISGLRRAVLRGQWIDRFRNDGEIPLAVGPARTAMAMPVRVGWPDCVVRLTLVTLPTRVRVLASAAQAGAGASRAKASAAIPQAMPVLKVSRSLPGADLLFIPSVMTFPPDRLRKPIPEVCREKHVSCQAGATAARRPFKIGRAHV